MKSDENGVISISDEIEESEMNGINLSKLDDDEKRKAVMENMAQLWLQAEVN